LDIFSCVYIDAKRVTLITDNTGNRIEMGYNLNGDVTSRAIRTAANAIVFQQSQTFDELGRMLKSIGATGQATSYAYDRTDLLKTVTDPRSTVFSYAYDALQRLISETGDVGGTAQSTVGYGRDSQDNIATYTDPRAIATTYVRNGFGEVIREASPDSGTTDYVRNALGDVTQMTDGRGVVTNYTYDNAGRMLTRTYPAATPENITYTWDVTTPAGNKGVGRLNRADDQTGYSQWDLYTSATRVCCPRDDG
jgi:YD repeat-containing protein